MKYDQAYSGNIDPYYHQRQIVSGDLPNTDFIKFTSAPIKAKVVTDMEKITELFASGIIDKETTLKIISEQLDKHGPKQGTSSK